MAETVTIAHGDTLSGILKRKRGLNDGQVYTWLRQLRPLNPHIGNLDRVFPGERVLIPDTLLECVSDQQVWQNAFSRIPRELESPHNGHTQLFLTTPGTTIDDIAKGMFGQGPHCNMPLSTKRAVLIHNNPELEQYLDTGRVPAKRLVDITPLRLTKFDKAYWQGERQLYSSYLRDMDPTTLEMFQQVGPEDTFIIKQLNGRVGFFKALGRHATWYVPTVIGLYNVYEASPEMRMHTLFAEGVGIVGGYYGAEFGAYLGGLFAISVLGLGPLGLFVTVFIFAAAGGMAGNWFGRGFGGQAYDLGNRFEDHVFHSIDELVGEF